MQAQFSTSQRRTYERRLAEEVAERFIKSGDDPYDGCGFKISSYPWENDTGIRKLYNYYTKRLNRDGFDEELTNLLAWDSVTQLVWLEIGRRIGASQQKQMPDS